MEASDAFAQEIGGEPDPFAGTDLDFDPPPEPVAPSPDGEPPQDAEPPIVDREGRRVDQTGEDAPVAAQEPPQAAEAPQADPTTPSGGEPEPEPAQDPTPPAASGGQTEAKPDPTPSSSTPSSGEATGDGGAATTTAASERPAPAAAESPGSTPEPDADSGGEDAPEPEEAKSKGGKVVKRRYLIYRVDGPDKLTQVTWYEDGKGKLSERGKSGARRQKVCLARGTDDALKFGYIAVGAPRNGVRLVAVAKLHFQPREVKPMPPEPSRQRLQIN